VLAKARALKKGVQGVQEFRSTRRSSFSALWKRSVANLLELIVLLVLFELLLYEISNSWKFRN